MSETPAYEALVAAWLARPGISTKRMLVSDGLADLRTRFVTSGVEDRRRTSPTGGVTAR
jgi:hypothetical protein